MAQGGFRVGIINDGSEAMASRLQAWRKIAGVMVAGIADPDPERARASSVTLGIPSIPFSTGSIEALLDLGVDAVDLCAGDSILFASARAALDRRIPILCAKAPGSTTAELRQIGELADRNGAIVMTAQPHRFGIQAQTFRHWIREDRSIGQPYHARVNLKQRSSTAGELPIIDPCALDLCLWLLDFPRPLRVTGAARKGLVRGPKNPVQRSQRQSSFTAGFIHFEKGMTLALESAVRSNHSFASSLHSCEIFGIDGTIQWPSGDYATVRSGSYLHGQLETTQCLEELDAAEVRSFYEAVLRRLSSPVPWQETERAMTIMEAIETSHRQKREVRL